MDFENILAHRKSIRSFTDQPIKRSDLDTILKQAQRIPSWVNSQPWKVYVAQGETLEKLRKIHRLNKEQEIASSQKWPTLPRTEWLQESQENMAEWSEDFLALLDGDRSLWENERIRLHNAQAIIYLALPKNASNWSIYDLGGFGTTVTLAASNLGIDSLVAYEFVIDTKEIQEMMEVDSHYDIVVGIGLGYRDESALINQTAQKRRPLVDFVSYKD